MGGWSKGLIGLVVGVVGLGTIRFVTVPPPHVTHHHANWAVFVDGHRLDLTAERFMEDVASCRTSPEAIRPQDRIHLHEGDADVVHVHHPASTWGQLLANLGMAAGEDFLRTPDGTLHVADGARSVTWIRNGRQEFDLANEVVRSEDRVVLSVGTATPAEVLESQFSLVADDAAEHNERADPASCMGGHEPETLGARLKRAFIG